MNDMESREVRAGRLDIPRSRGAASGFLLIVLGITVVVLVVLVALGAAFWMASAISRVCTPSSGSPTQPGRRSPSTRVDKVISDSVLP